MCLGLKWRQRLLSLLWTRGREARFDWRYEARDFLLQTLERVGRRLRIDRRKSTHDCCCGSRKGWHGPSSLLLALMSLMDKEIIWQRIRFFTSIVNSRFQLRIEVFVLDQSFEH